MDNFWEGFFLILIFLPLIYFWGFACVDLFTRKDLSGWSIALWLLVIIFLPVFGVLMYFIFRPVTARDVEAAEAYAEERDFAKAAQTTDKLHKLSELRDKGDISQEEFEKQKAKLLKE
jgi:flagellar biosynthesis/type III secretory pathway M-ring protein FliF/YscJ